MASHILEYEHELRVRYSDTDKMKVVHNANYQIYFEVSRTEMLRSYGVPYAELEERGYLLPLVEACVRYISPAFYDDLLTVTVRIEPVPSPRLRIEYEIKRGDTLIANGHTLHSFVDRESLRPVRPPKDFFATLGRTAGNAG